MFLSKYLTAADHPNMKGKGGRIENNTRKALQGLTKKTLKHHKPLQPLFLILGAGFCLVTCSLARSAIWGTDLNWSKSKDISDSNHLGYYENKRFKILNPKGLDYNNLPDKREAPKYKEDED